MKKLGKVLTSIVAGILGFLGAICIAPLVVLYLLINIPCSVIQDIWEEN